MGLTLPWTYFIVLIYKLVPLKRGPQISRHAPLMCISSNYWVFCKCLKNYISNSSQGRHEKAYYNCGAFLQGLATTP